MGGKQIKFKNSAMPFVQMENISHFLNAISAAPISLSPHDRFLTVDLYEKKDPAQVLQCLGAFSRVAHNVNPSAFPETVGGFKSTISPQTSGDVTGRSPGRQNGGPPPLPAKKVSVTAWTKPEQERATAPAWNVVQYGYMGGASQGNQGISFGGRRQITSTPVGTMQNLTLEERERRRNVEAEERERLRRQQEEEKRRETEVEREKGETLKRRELELERVAREKEEALRQAEVLRRWNEDEVKRFQEEERKRQEEEAQLLAEQKRWAEEEQRKQWRLKQEQQRENERDAARTDEDRSRKQDEELLRERERVRELERELERARERERHYEAEKETRRREETERMRRDAAEVIRHRTGERPPQNQRTNERYINSHLTGERALVKNRTEEQAVDRESKELEEERRFLQSAWARETVPTPPITEPADSRPVSLAAKPNPPLPVRALPNPPRKLPPTPMKVRRKDSWEEGDDERPLDSPTKEEQTMSWSRYLLFFPPCHTPFCDRLLNTPVNSMSFLERERERERQRQKEWERNQQATQKLAESGTGHEDEGPAWNEAQYGYADDILDLY
jgi:hypothetical protein